MDNPYAGDSDQQHEKLRSSVDIEAHSERIPLHKVPFAFFFQPGKYMLRNGIHASQLIVTLVIWISGMSMVIDRLEQSAAFGRPIVWMPESWGQLAAAAMIIGILRGLVVYGIGGWWYRVRLGFCGVKDAEWSTTGRVYMLSGTAKHLGLLVFTVIGAMSFPTFKSYASNEDGIMIFVALVVQMTLVFWSSFTLYFGSRAVFPIERVWSLVWFLILPIILRLFGLATILVLVFMQSMSPEPMLDNPDQHTSDSFSFEYPSNWFTTLGTEIPGPETWIQVEPDFADAVFEIDIEYVGADEDKVAQYFQSMTENSGMEFSESTNELTTFGPYSGHGSRRTGTLDGSKYIVEVFQTPINDFVAVIFLTIVERSIADDIQPGFDHVLKTAKITDPYTLTPNLDRTYTAMQDELQFDIPSNWWLTNTRGDETTAEDGTVFPPSVTMEAQTPGYGVFRIYIYNSDLTPRSELAVTINSYSGSDQLIEEQPIDQLMGVSGYGAAGKYISDLDMEWNITILIAQLTDGRLIEFQSAYPTDHAEHYTPGYDHIAQTLKINQDLITSP
jgi:hypothetical protein